MSAGEPSDALWRFAVTLYDRPKVAAACLDLQDEHGCDVIMLLFAAWMAAEHRVELSDEEVDAAVAAVRPWQDEVVKPLRAIRRRLKTGLAPAPATATEVSRTKIKSLEIEMERIEFSALAELGRHMKARDGDVGRGIPITENLTRVAAAYGSRVVDSSLSGLARELDRLAEFRVLPLMIISDNGTELTSHAILR